MSLPNLELTSAKNRYGGSSPPGAFPQHFKEDEDEAADGQRKPVVDTGGGMWQWVSPGEKQHTQQPQQRQQAQQQHQEQHREQRQMQQLHPEPQPKKPRKLDPAEEVLEAVKRI